LNSRKKKRAKYPDLTASLVCRMMKDRKLLIYSTTLFLTLAIWWLTFSVTYTQNWLVSVFLFPLILILAGSWLARMAVKKSVAGLLVTSIPMFGTGVIMALGLATQYPAVAIRAWPIIPILAGVGILIENHLGIGWRFTDRQAYQLVFLSVMAFILTNTFSLDWLQSLINPGNGQNLPVLPRQWFKGLFSIHFPFGA
jgi:hypothetical protein